VTGTREAFAAAPPERMRTASAILNRADSRIAHSVVFLGFGENAGGSI
jgi:hypothetical protein